ncbi:MAG: bifunctional phosphoribosyl-AMP cyclohydrolase/phosphoribosyl-ATP diphosphatase HisIE [Ruminococcaceae bacterium]|nr:bifunctional phosphoribosyl-AMP cyclohydrolase/phosphoribosyl-ATP diphosphatase HisIE [Oscillospiraceae bacterium]
MERMKNMIKYDENGLIPAVIQDEATDEVLMVAYMNEETLQETMETGRTVFYSRSRQERWRKGDTSGNIQKVVSIRLDCDGDCLLIRVEQTGAACHTGKKSCFYRKYEEGNWNEAASETANMLTELYGVVLDRQQDPQPGSYTNYLLDAGLDKIAKKVGEECVETILAAKNSDKEEIAAETADLFYHLTVLLAERGVTYEDVFRELKERR